MFSTQTIREMFKIPEDDTFKCHDGIMNITTGTDSRVYYQSDSQGRAVAKYKIVIETPTDHEGSLTWSRTDLTKSHD